MHHSNRKFWDHCSNIYPNWFKGPNRILEVGSLNVNGSVRDHFSGFTEYVGVDWRPGPCVDVVCLAENMSFDHTFDVVISASMLEHDPNWIKSIERIVQYVDPEKGALFLSWGAAKNGAHCANTAVDGKHHALKAGLVLAELNRLGIYIHEFHYEGNLPYVKKKWLVRGGIGEVVLFGVKNRKLVNGNPTIDELIKEDCC
jgi:hypothetical protein